MKFDLRTIGVIIGILLIVSPVFGEAIGAETINIDIDDASTSSNIYELEGEYVGTRDTVNYLLVRNVELLQAPFALILHANIVTRDGLEYADYIPIILTSPGLSTIYGYGNMGYQTFPDGTGYIWLDIDSFNYGGSGSKVFAIKNATDGVLVSKVLSCRIVADPYGIGPMPTDLPLAFGGETIISNGYCGIYTYNIFKNFKQKIAVTYSPEIDKTSIDNIAVARVVDGNSYKSTVEISAKSGVYHESTSVDAPISINISSLERPYQINVFGHATETWYNKTVLSGHDTPTDDASVTVYIKNSQTGALIANANIVIDALVDGEYYPVTNRTEPSGIFTITLQPTGGGKPNPDGYRLIVTADGYNNPMPEINFTVDDYKNYIYCLLDPIAGGPVNENKTFIDFFVRDVSSNPISGATVKFGKYTLITNSAGYTVFEVDKNNNYTWVISKSGYGALTGNAVIGDAPRHTINTVLAPLVTPTTTTPIPTSPPIGPTPTMTAPTGEHVSNWLEWFAAHFGMILGGGVEIGKIFMWLCFSVPVGVYVGKEAKAGAAGFMAGAGIVTLFFVLIGWVPIWLVVLLALIIGLLYAKVFNSQDNGGGR
ncbi:MAG: carboxypeptidase-like regulatory domain-containing protein [Bacilli bacterium]|nr:carboxypeptidase-like regulatory domain-containing protein [Bacilli bacterium]